MGTQYLIDLGEKYADLKVDKGFALTCRFLSWNIKILGRTLGSLIQVLTFNLYRIYPKLLQLEKT